MVFPVATREQSRLLRVVLALLPMLSAFMWVGESNSNLYAVAEYFLTYKHGFVKRGLVGELLSHLGYLSASHVQWIEVASLLFTVVVSYAIFRRMLAGPFDAALVAVLFLCSPAALSHLGILAAQPDVVLFAMLLLAYGCLVRLPENWAPLTAFVPCAVALLVHEGFLLLFYPAVLALLWDGYRNRRFSLAPILVHLAALATLFVCILRFGKIHINPEAFYYEAHARTDVPFDAGIFFVLTNTLGNQIHDTMIGYSPAFMAGVLLSALFLLPAVVGMFVILLRVNLARAAPLPAWGIAAVFVAPLGLMILGHDVMRWVAGSVVGISLLLAWIAETDREVFAASFPASRMTAFGVILYGFAVGPLGGASIRIVVQTLHMLRG